MAEGRAEHDWLIASSLQALIANCHRDPKKRRKPYGPDDFNPLVEHRAVIEKAPITALKVFLK